jgi:hypothetical protein
MKYPFSAPVDLVHLDAAATNITGLLVRTEEPALSVATPLLASFLAGSRQTSNYDDKISVKCAK